MVLQWQLVDGGNRNKDSIGDYEVPILERESVRDVLEGANYCVEVMRVVGSRVPSFEHAANVDVLERINWSLIENQNGGLT